MSEEGYGSLLKDPLLSLPAAAPNDLPDFLDYLVEKGLTVEPVLTAKKVGRVNITGVKPKYFEKVVLPELKRRLETWKHRITYRYKTCEKSHKTVTVHLDLWWENSNVEIVRFGSRR